MEKPQTKQPQTKQEDLPCTAGLCHLVRCEQNEIRKRIDEIEKKLDGLMDMIKQVQDKLDNHVMPQG